MIKEIRLRKGLDLKLAGEAIPQTENLKRSSIYGIRPTDFIGLKPKLTVKEGDKVKAGDSLFINKLSPSVKYVSPVSGTIVKIERGERRKLMSVQIASDEKDDYRQFKTFDLAAATKDSILDLLCESGIFGFIRQRPYDIVADPQTTPKAIFVSAFNKMPLAADFTYVVQGQEEDFQTGLTVLSKLSKVYLGISKEQSSSSLSQLRSVETTIFNGPNPAGNVSVHINHISPINKGEIVWTVTPDVVIFIGRLIRKGTIDFNRTMAVAGSIIKNPHYVSMIVGAPISDIVNSQLKQTEHIRIINGNPLVGQQCNLNDFVGAYSTEITVIPEGDNINETLGWIMPRFNQFSSSRSYFSWLFPKSKTYDLDARIKGGKRHMIMSGEYDRVFPMDIYAGYLIKAIITRDIDKMEALGIYEISPEDFAVAEFIDSSKLELQRIVREGLDILRKEMA